MGRACGTRATMQNEVQEILGDEVQEDIERMGKKVTRRFSDRRLRKATGNFETTFG